MSLHTPYFSIIIPCLNEAKFLPHLLTDLTHQSFADFEAIIVDAHSNDQTAAKAKAIGKKLPHFKLIQDEIRNVSHQRNLGAKFATSDNLVFMDADNRLPPYFLQGLAYRFEVLKPDMFTTYILPDTNNTKDQAITTAVNIYFELYKHSSKPSLLESMLGFNRIKFHQLSGFDPAIKWGEGGDLVTRAIKKNYSFDVFKDPQYQYSLRRLRSQGTLNSARKFAQLAFRWYADKRFTGSDIAAIYPMKGGAYPQKSPTLSIHDLSQILQLPTKYLSKLNTSSKASKSLQKILDLFSSVG
jgi:glycosyltransferase involved in cell wall biosynthesis